MLHQRGVPRCCQRERDGIDRAEAVDDVESEAEWNMEARLLDSNVLQMADPLWIRCGLERTDFTFANMILKGNSIRRAVDCDLGHLPKLFGKRHFAHQIFDKAVSLRVVWDRDRTRECCGLSSCIDRNCEAERHCECEY